jgi:hypothetical protein
MTRKDIALTVGGVLATMVVAYLIYKMQQRDAAAAAAAQPASSTGDAYQVNGDTTAMEYAALLSGVAGPLTGTMSNTTGAVASSGSTADTGATGTSIDYSDGSDLLREVIAAYADSFTTQSSNPQTVASMTIPTLAGAGASDIADIPVTAGQANAGASASLFSPAGTSIVNSTAPYMASMQSSAAVSSHPVAEHPIVASAVN